MRVVLVSHGLPPHERTGVETHVAALAAALGRQGAEVMVFAPRRGGGLPHLAERCEPRPGYRVHWLHLDRGPRDASERFEAPGVAGAFADFLDRERPEVAHVHHLEKLGAGIVLELERRGIPTVFTAHDHWARCHRATLLRPDLERCATPGQVEACARCDRAAALLNSLPDLGDYHAGVLPEQLAEGERAALAELLDGPAPQALPPDGTLTRRRELDLRRRALLGRFARAFAPTRLVARELVAAGVPAERVVLAPYGIERELLERVPPPRFQAERPVRFGYVGGLTKHKGVHVLLSAFAGRFAPAELVVFGASNDGPYNARLAALASAGGARLAGAFDHHRLPEVLESIDVLCVPSLWDENAPFVIREAFAAGRPVLASAVGALDESVRDGVDGLLLPPGDVEAWRAALDGLAAEPERAQALAAGVRPPPALEESVRELVSCYRELVAERAAAGARPAAGLAHLAELEARRSEARRETLDGLRARALHGLERLRGSLRASGEWTDEPRRSALWPDPAEGELQDLARDRRREREWLLEAVRAGEGARAELAAEARWLRALVAARDAERADGVRAVEALAAEARWLRGLLEGREAELGWVRGTLEAREEELDWLRGVAADHAAAREYFRIQAGRAGLDAGAPEAAP